MIAHSWSVVLPPIFVLLTAFLTKKTKLSLLVGILSAGLIAQNFTLIPSLSLIVHRFYEDVASLQNMYMFCFLACLGVIIHLITISGSAYVFGAFITRQISDQRSAETCSLLLSFGCFFDDYFNALTVGCIMRQLTDKFKIARAKLAFLIDSLAAPLTVIIPITSWLATISKELVESGVSLSVHDQPTIIGDPFAVYLQSIPFVLYSLILIASVWFIVRRKISFGAMHQHELTAQKTGNLFNGKAALEETVTICPANRAHLLDFFAPIIVLFMTVIGGVLATGKYWVFGGTASFLEAFSHADIFLTLFTAGLVTLLTATLLPVARRHIQYQELPKIYYTGISLMGGSIITLLLAWTFSTLLRSDLHTGAYLAHLLLGSINLAWFPVMFFFAALTISIATGSSWATVGVVIPIAIPMLTSFLGLTTPVNAADVTGLFPLLGAILSGAVAGDHISPISDTTIMAAASSGAYLFDHVRTQLTYALPIIFSTSIAFLVSGLCITAPYAVTLGASLAAGLASSLTILTLRNMLRIHRARK